MFILYHQRYIVFSLSVDKCTCMSLVCRFRQNRLQNGNGKSCVLCFGVLFCVALGDGVGGGGACGGGGAQSLLWPKNLDNDIYEEDSSKSPLSSLFVPPPCHSFLPPLKRHRTNDEE